ncbi:hypothetical protein [Flavobacterium sp.]|jgi:hypothetical protein|uniref:hypothetical protein n=1 Tax=Flavobacterium sp. TaxID=239 RepID=UPI0037C03691
MSVLTVLIRDSMQPLRLLVALCSLTWAVSLFLPGEAFSEAPYTIMAAIAPENLWGMFFLMIGIANWVIVCKGLFLQRTLIVVSFITCLVWTVSISAIFYSYWIEPTLNSFFPPTHMASDFWIATTAWWLLVTSIADYIERTNCERRDG